MSSERLAISSADLDEIDQPALDRFLRERAPTLLEASGRDEAGIRLGLLAKIAPRVVPTLVGLYAFGRVPQYLFPEWGVSCVAIEGRTLADPILRRADLEGPLPALVEGALRFVSDATGGTPGAADTGQYALDLVREAVVNALVHRDLRKTSRVAVRVFADRLEVWSPGGPPEGQGDLEELGREGGFSQPRNPLLAAIARHHGLGEQLGRGLLLLVQRGGLPTGERVEVRATPRDVEVTIPSRWSRPGGGVALS